MLSVIALVLSAGTPAGEIAYVNVSHAGDTRIVVTDVASGGEREVFRGPSPGAPVWSPDGEWLAFEIGTDNGRAMYVVRADGSEGRIVSRLYPQNGHPAWSPDGTRLAYAAGETLLRTIVVCHVAAGRERSWGNTEVALQAPVWLPDPEMIPTLVAEDAASVPAGIVFDAQSGGLLAVALLPRRNADYGETGVGEGNTTRSWRSLTTDIYVVTLRHAFPLPAAAMPSPEGRYVEWAPRPDPRGQSVAFESNDGGDREIFLATVKGAYDLSNHRAADWNPVWAPNGRWLAFESFRGGTRGVYRVHRDTARVIPVAAAPDAEYWAPAWSPDGGRLAYVGNENGQPQILIIEVETGETRPLTEGPTESYAPTWRPVTP